MFHRAVLPCTVLYVVAQCCIVLNSESLASTAVCCTACHSPLRVLGAIESKIGIITAASYSKDLSAPRFSSKFLGETPSGNFQEFFLGILFTGGPLVIQLALIFQDAVDDDDDQRYDVQLRCLALGPSQRSFE